MDRLFGGGRSTLLLLVALALLLPGAALAQSPEDERPTTAQRKLLDRLGDARVYRSDATGNVSLIGATTTRDAIGRPTGLPANASPVAAARAHLSEYGALFGLRDQARQLRAEEAEEVSRGRSVVHFQQLHGGVPVLGGELNVQLTETDGLLVANGEVFSGTEVGTDPRLSEAEARGIALSKIAKDRDLGTADLDVTDPELWVYDPKLLGAPGPQLPTLVWRVTVGPKGLDHFRELVLVDAHTGAVVLDFDQVPAALDRKTFTANNDPTTTFPGDLVCDEVSACPDEDTDAVNAHRYTKDTYDFYLDNHARDSLDGAGMTITSTVDVCHPALPCPLNNAAWLGAQKHAVYGDGNTTDDVVGHELTHGVTDHESDLFYYYQSGAINESFSDVWGEFIDLTNGSGTDTREARWKVGEDLPGSGAFRDMEDPTLFGHPDRLQSPHYTADPYEWDHGGVHYNSGVNNKAAYLMTDGDTFNGETVTGLGIPKVARIYYEAQTNLLTSASDYQDLYAALQQSCTNLTGTSSITASDCQEVKDAVDATEMNQTPAAAPAPEAPVCPTGQTPGDLFSDDLEDPQSGNWALQGTGWYYPQNSHPYGSRRIAYATSGETHFWGDSRGVSSDHSIAKATGVPIPSGESTYLRFDHAYGFEDDDQAAYDGGVLEYSTDGGSSWLDAGSLITDNGYNGTIGAGGGNPLGGREGFVRESNGYISSRVDLSPLAGQSVRFRFRIGEDSTGYDYGWFVDDVRVYTCDIPDAIPPKAPVIDSPANNSFDTDGTITFSGTAEANSKIEVFEGDASRSKTTAGLSGAWSKTIDGVSNGSHTYTATATDAAGNASAESEARTVIVDTVPPKVKRVFPAENATGVGSGVKVLVAFPEAMRAASINTNSLKLFKTGTSASLRATVAYDAATKRATLDPSSNLKPGAKYRAMVTPGAKDAAGNRLDQDPSVTGNQGKVWSFRIVQ